MTDANLPSIPPNTKPNPLMYVGPLALFLAAAAYGVLEVHHSADTWIGLASGRQILTSGEVPTTDSFSFTVAGRLWYNQNWLAHTIQYWLYSRVSPAAVVYATWIQSASIFLLILLAAYWRGGAWSVALPAAALAAFGCRDYLYARPATMGFVCLAALWAIICRLDADPGRRRWTAITLLAPLLILWSAMHGSFIFGYGILGLYVAYNLVMRLIRPRAAISGGSIIAIIAVAGAAFVLACLLGPFGLENFTHGEKVASSSIFRKVSEWYSPLAHRHHFPPVWRFWTIVIAAPVLIALCALTRRLTPTVSGAGESGAERRHDRWGGPPCPSLRPSGGHGGPPHRSADVTGAHPESGRARLTLFDAAMVVLGLSMALWARRFAPIFFILAAPIAAALAARLLRGRSLARLRTSVAAVSLAAAVALGCATWRQARADLIANFESTPEFNLLERAVRYDQSPHEAIRFIQQNELPLRVLTEWSQAGMVMFHAPSAKVYIDGRVQQVYDEEHCAKYAMLLLARDTPDPLLMELLDEPGVDAALLRRWDRVKNLRGALKRSPQWVAAFMTKRSTLFLRRESPGLKRLGELLRDGREQRPATPRALASRGFVWEAVTPPELNRALESWRAAVRKNIALGAICFSPMTHAMLDMGMTDEARRFVERYRKALARPVANMPESMRTDLLAVLDECARDIAERE